MIRSNKEKCSKPRKVNIGFHHRFRQKNWPAKAKAKEEETLKQAPIPAKPAKASAQSPVNQSIDIQSPKYCAICIPTEKICPIEYPILKTADWPDFK